MYKIGELSKLCSLPVKTLRYYDEIGLLVPDEIDQFTGYRYYSASKLSTCYRIIALKALGFSLEEIKASLAARSDDEVLRLIETHSEKLKSSIIDTESKLKKLETLKEIITEGEKKMFDLIIKNSDDIHVACVRNIYKSKDAAYFELKRLRSAIPATITGKSEVIINYETEYSDSDFDFAVCVEINGRLPKGIGASEKSLRFDETASVICKAEELQSAYRFVIEQVEALPAQITGPFYEIYHEDCIVELKVPVCQLAKERIVPDDKPIFEFIPDDEMIGKWEFLDRVPAKEQFVYGYLKERNPEAIWLKDIFFMPGGKGYWIIDGWTKGSFTTRFNWPRCRYRHELTIERRGEKTLMFVEMKDNYEIISRGGKPMVYVYEKTSSEAFEPNSIGIKDEVNYPFIPDERAIGLWLSVDCIHDPNGFDPNSRHPGVELFVRGIEFQPEGRAVYKFDRELNPFYSVEWTKGMILDKHLLTNSAYEIKTINGKEYLFSEWKSGDYIYGGRVNGYYVFEKDNISLITFIRHLIRIIAPIVLNEIVEQLTPIRFRRVGDVFQIPF